MGAITKEDVEAFAAQVLKELRLDDWKMEWTKNSSGICLKCFREILIPERVVGQYPWEAKEYVLHETAHIFTDDHRHGAGFYRVYVALLNQFMVMSLPLGV